MIGNYLSPSLGIAWRYLPGLYTANPAIFLPSLLFPLFFLAAFAGGLSAVGDTPGFNYYDFTAFEFCFVLLQASALAGVFAGFSIASDFERGLGKRMMLAIGHRSSIVVGYAIGAAARLGLTRVVITGVALLGGMSISGSGLDLVGMYSLGLLVSAIGRPAVRVRHRAPVPFARGPAR